MKSLQNKSFLALSREYVSYALEINCILSPVITFNTQCRKMFFLLKFNLFGSRSSIICSGWISWWILSPEVWFTWTHFVCTISGSKYQPKTIQLISQGNTTKKKVFRGGQSLAWHSGLKGSLLLQLWLGFNPRPGNFHMLQIWLYKKIGINISTWKTRINKLENHENSYDDPNGNLNQFKID